MKNIIIPEKNVENDLFDEKLMKESIRILYLSPPSEFSSDVLILGNKNFKKIMIILKGLPYSGKSLLIRRFQSKN